MTRRKYDGLGRKPAASLNAHPIDAAITLGVSQILSVLAQLCRTNLPGCGMVNSNAFTAWRLFQLNWIPIAAMGAVALVGGALCGFTIEPVALGITLAISAALALIPYLYAFAKGDQADPKLIFPLGALSQLLLIGTIMGPLPYVAGVLNWPLQDHTLLAIDRQ